MIGKMFQRLRVTAVFFVLFCSVSMFAQDSNIYMLWPFSDMDNISLQTAKTVQQPEKFWQEKIIVNGTELQLDISLVETRLSELRQLFDKQFRGRKDVAMGGNSNSIFLQEIQKDGSCKRQYYLELSGIHPVLLFEMTLPLKRLKITQDDWPAELPLLQEAVDLTCMEFPVRGAVYGAFDLEEMLMPQALGEMVTRLEAMGWERVSREADNVFEGRGEVFLKDNASKLMILGLVPTGKDRGVRVSMYTRAISGGKK